MSLTYTYTDAFIGPKITTAIETRAIADVADLGTLPQVWVDRLVVLRAYILTCLEKLATADDAWSVKLGAYRKEYHDIYTKAVIAQTAVNAMTGTSSGNSFTSINLERG